MPLDENTLFHFKFKVDKNTDMLCTGDDGYGFCKITYHKNVNNLKTILKSYINKLTVEDCLKSGTFLTELYNTMPCKEKPYKLYLYGADDRSYTKTYKSLDEVKKVALTLQSFDKIYVEKFIKDYNLTFTN